MKGTEKTYRSKINFSQEKLTLISQQAVNRIDELLQILGVDNLRRERKMFVGPCPIHGGDRDNAFNLYVTGDAVVGNWKCRSHQCERIFQPTLIGFVRGILSKNNLNWSGRRDEKFSFGDTVQFLLKFLNEDYDNIEVDLSKVEKTRYADYTIKYYSKNKTIKTKIPRSTVRKIIKKPQYFIDRGYSEEILDKYDVTFCNDPSKHMYKRCVAPVYDDDHEYMVGCTGRSIFEKCPDCSSYHNIKLPCPLPEDTWKYSKWKHSSGFSAEEWLYNYWYAKEHILKHGCALLVESPGNVWRLEEAGIHISLGMFGTSLTNGQLDALNRCGAMNILLALDNDNAGELAIDPLIEELSKLYNVEVIDYDEDIGDSEITKLQKKLIPQIERMYIV